jgi:hypothetical protein
MITIIHFYTIKVLKNVEKKLILIQNIYNINCQTKKNFYSNLHTTKKS